MLLVVKQFCGYWGSVFVHGYCSKIQSSMKSDTKYKTRLVDVTKMIDALGGDMSEVVIDMNSFKGCDRVSVFDDRGKLTMFREMKSRKTFPKSFQCDRLILDCIPWNVLKTTDSSLPNVNACCFSY